MKDIATTILIQFFVDIKVYLHPTLVFYQEIDINSDNVTSERSLGLSSSSLAALILVMSTTGQVLLHQTNLLFWSTKLII